MKRGLKGIGSVEISGIGLVATIAPMKRGLKDPNYAEIDSIIDSSNHCPDEKGTERRVNIISLTCTGLSSNHCPDEKGTESQPRDRNPVSVHCSNHCPDEKGTES